MENLDLTKKKEFIKKPVLTEKFTVKIKKNYELYLLLIPGLIYVIIFKYTPMYGMVIAFQDFDIFSGIWGSPWVGLKNFSELFHSSGFYEVFRNTFLISVYKIVFLFPLPIFVALVLNEVKNMVFKRFVQTAIYLPHFLSWVIIAGLFTTILSTNGIINNVISAFGGKPISFLMDNNWFRSLLVITAGWKEAGWSAIIYMATIAGLDQSMYEAAKIDGAGRLKLITFITLPCLSSTIILLLILKLGHILDAGTEQILMMYNPMVYKTSDVIGTYVYRMGLGKMNYSFSTALGLFNSVIGFILVMVGNKLSRKVVKKGIW